MSLVEERHNLRVEQNSRVWSQKPLRLAMCRLPAFFGFVGCWIRFFLAPLNRMHSSKLQGGCQVLVQRFPLGTLGCNVGASALSALATGFLGLYFKSPSLERDALQAVSAGVAGSMSTMSTFCNELRSVLTVWDAYLYATASVALAFVSGLAVRSAF